MAERPTPPPRWLNAAIEWSPALVFFGVYHLWGFFPATGAVMAATAISVALIWRLGRRIPVLPLVSLVLVVALGGLTLWLQSELFTKAIPTLVNGLFAAVLLFGYVRGLPLLRHAIGPQMPAITAWAWRRLTLRYVFFFAALAGLNVVVWRTQTTDVWVAFRTYGDLGLLLLFIASQVPFVGRHMIAAQASRASGP